MDNGTKPLNDITVTYGKLKKVVSALETLDLKDDSEVSFEYIVGSCFPDILKNIKNRIAFQYTQGYLDGIAGKEKTNN